MVRTPVEVSSDLRGRAGERAGLEALELSPPNKSDAMPRREVHELSHSPEAYVEVEPGEATKEGTARKRLVLRDRDGLTSSVAGLVGGAQGKWEAGSEEADEEATGDW